MSLRLAALEAYVPGEQPRDMQYIKLNTNESPFDPSPEVKAAVTSGRAASLQLYPEPDCTGLSDALAMHYGVRRAVEQPLDAIRQRLGRDTELLLCGVF